MYTTIRDVCHINDNHCKYEKNEIVHACILYCTYKNHLCSLASG